MDHLDNLCLILSRLFRIIFGRSELFLGCCSYFCCFRCFVFGFRVLRHGHLRNRIARVRWYLLREFFHFCYLCCFYWLFWIISNDLHGFHHLLSQLLKRYLIYSFVVASVDLIFCYFNYFFIIVFFLH